MIILDRVTKTRRVNGRPRDVLSLANVHIPSNRRIALFAPSTEDSNLVINLLAGIESPTSGSVRRTASVSFPVGHTGSVRDDLTVRHNIAHVARLYGADPSAVVHFMQNIANLGDILDLRFRDLSNPLKRRFAHILAFSIPFDVYLLKAEPTRIAAKDRDIACALFEARTRTSGAIVAVRNVTFAKKYCDMALSLIGGKLLLLDDVEQAMSACRTGAGFAT